MIARASALTGMAGVALILGVAGCGSQAAPPPREPSSPNASVAAGTPTITGTTEIATDLTTPWGMAFLPDGTALVSERDSGSIVRITPRAGGLATVTNAGQVDGVFHNDGGEEGLLGLAVAPGSNPKQVFAYYTTSADNRIASFDWDGSQLTNQRPILTGIPANSIHDGGRLAFGPDGFLYAGTGDAGEREDAQEMSSLGGKILRITAAGAVPADNPFPGSPIWTLGHRNVQGLAFDSRGQLWASEFGQDEHDELNKITKGANYGWPIHEGASDDPKYASPYAQWPTAEASPSGLAILGDWAYMAALRGERLWQINLSHPPLERAGEEPNALLVGSFGRLRTATAAPDGSIWLTTSNTDGRGDPRAGDDKILRVTTG